uniref:Uncharacterized protein n=1 Tax=Manihot esculenta TaxID=3983 RepID=A0A199UBL2_MANES
MLHDAPLMAFLASIFPSVYYIEMACTLSGRGKGR